MTTSPSYERITAGEIRPGDRVARARTHPFAEVREVRPGATSVRLLYNGAGSDRPRKTALWWREVRT